MEKKLTHSKWFLYLTEFFAGMSVMAVELGASRAALTDGDYAAMMAEVAADLTVCTGGDCLLTDDRAPVEVLGMRVLDELIAGELDYYRENFSLQEILGMLG